MRIINKNCYIPLDIEGLQFSVHKIVNYYPYRTATAIPFSIMKFERNTNDAAINQFRDEVFKTLGKCGDNHCAFLVETCNEQKIYLHFSDFNMYICLNIEEKNSLESL